MKAKEQITIEKNHQAHQAERIQRIILNEKTDKEKSKVFSVQRDDSPLRTLFG